MVAKLRIIFYWNISILSDKLKYKVAISISWSLGSQQTMTTRKGYCYEIENEDEKIEVSYKNCFQNYQNIMQNFY